MFKMLESSVIVLERGLETVTGMYRVNEHPKYLSSNIYHCAIGLSVISYLTSMLSIKASLCQFDICLRFDVPRARNVSIVRARPIERH
jgi:hypothetical protein